VESVLVHTAAKAAIGAIAVSVIYTAVVGHVPFYTWFVTPAYDPYYGGYSGGYTPPSSTPATASTDPYGYSGSSGTPSADPYGSSSTSSDPYGSSITPSDPYGSSSTSSDPLSSSNDPSGSYLDLPGTGSGYVPPVAQESYEYPEQPMPFNGETQIYAMGEAIAPFKIRSQGESNYLVKLVDSYTGYTAMTIFVRGGNDVDALVPLGTYEVRYASGLRWYGYDHLFGQYTGYSKADQTFVFSQEGDQISGYSITLYAVEGGNLSTSLIPPESF
jgi:hypothetical protein